MQKKYFSSTDARNIISIYGFAIFPIHGIAPDGSCTCGKQDCGQKGKHPATRNGCKDATSDIEQIKNLWQGRQYLNFGIATGEASGIFVIDIDSDVGERLIKEAVPDMPETLTATTGRGKHLFFRYPGEPVLTKRGVLSGVDVRGDGGYVVGAGSHHAGGSLYEFVNPLEQIADAPEALLNMVVKSRSHANTNDTPTFRETYTPPVSRLALTRTTEDKAREHLSYIDPDCGYDDWIAVGMALHHEGLPLSLWDDWSRRGTKYKQNETAWHWKSFRSNGGTSYGTIVHMARQGGMVVKQQDFEQPPAPTQQPPIADTAAEQVTEEHDPDTGEIIPDNKYANYIRGCDIKFTPDTNDFVQGLLSKGGMSVVYGESNCGKTFFMADLSFHIAENRAWRDKRIDGGGVAYVVLEGLHGLTGRIEAYKRTNGDSLEDLIIFPTYIDFLDSSPDKGDVAQFIKAIQELQKDTPLKMIVIDTLARAIGGGDENSGQDMGLLVQHADLIRSVTGAHICFVHHSGKDKAKGARGHSSLRAAVDTEIEISRGAEDDYSTVKIVKQRDMDMAEDMFFKLERVVLGQNSHLEEISSCVVKPIDTVERVKNTNVLNDMQAFVLDAIHNAMARCGTSRNVSGTDRQTILYNDLKDELETMGFKEMVDDDKVKTATNTIRVSLRRKGKIGFNRNLIWLLD